MNIVRILTPHGETIATYPDAVAVDRDTWVCVFDTALPSNLRDYTAKGNWIAAFKGPIIVWEEPQHENSEGTDIRR